MTKTEWMLIIIGSTERLCTLTVPPRPSTNGARIEKVITAQRWWHY